MDVKALRKYRAMLKRMDKLLEEHADGLINPANDKSYMEMCDVRDALARALEPYKGFK